MFRCINSDTKKVFSESRFIEHLASPKDTSITGLAHPKLSICQHLLTIMLLQILMTYSPPWNKTGDESWLNFFCWRLRSLAECLSCSLNTIQYIQNTVNRSCQDPEKKEQKGSPNSYSMFSKSLKPYDSFLWVTD